MAILLLKKQLSAEISEKEEIAIDTEQFLIHIIISYDQRLAHILTIWVI